ncbi:non-structural maintenance of chromosomes element 3 homolog [Polistes fuscatus]|uniref:non-structural maintenance of chromosomes element 3 homolog n=1 Tax=Polistes fuscatus TaxID=30207 RepID=UPI001CAA2656|nr:non-structural maintenance of chromosomes element 3 homolog [Polistes fuscatus]
MHSRLRATKRSNVSKYISEDEESEHDENNKNMYKRTSSDTRRYLSQDSGTKQMKKNAKIIERNAFSQASSSDYSESLSNEKLRNEKSRNVTEQEELDLAGRVIRYIFTVEKKKTAITKVQIIKNVLGGSTKNFLQIMKRVKLLLSQVFGYKLVDIGNSKYIMVNEIKNSIPHLNFNKPTKAEQVLLFIILCHIFMYEDVCTEENLWDFLTHLKIIKEDNFQHNYFGDVKKLVTVDFVSQQYLEKTVLYKGDSPKYEYKWGPRAEHEISYRNILEFVSKVHGKRPINSWPLQYKTMLAKEQSNKT